MLQEVKFVHGARCGHNIVHLESFAFLDSRNLSTDPRQIHNKKLSGLADKQEGLLVHHAHLRVLIYYLTHTVQR